MGEISPEFACGELPVRKSVADLDRSNPKRPAGAAVTVTAGPALLLDLFGKFIDHIDAARRMHPAEVRVEALVDEELPPGRRTVSVEPLVPRHLQLRAEVPAGVRVDEQQRVAVRGQPGRDGDAVGALALDPGRRTVRSRLARIEASQIVEIDPLD